MIVTLLEKEGMDSLLLPEKGRGGYWLRDWSSGENMIVIKRSHNRWILESNINIQILETGGRDVDKAVLYPCTLYTLYRKDTDQFLYLLTESEGAGSGKYMKYMVNGNTDILIGRSEKNAICFRNIAVSAIHARLARTADTWIIYDENSRNGVYVNHVRIQGRCRLKPGDMVYIMGLRLIIGKGFLAVNNPDRSVHLDMKVFSILKKRLVFKEDWNTGRTKQPEFFSGSIHKKQMVESCHCQFEPLVGKGRNATIEQCIERIMNGKEDFWNKEILYEDFLKLKVGNGDAEIDFKKHFIMGITGKWKHTLAFARWLLLQMITYYRYDELKIAFLLNKEGKKGFETARWLPHVWDGKKQVRLFAYDMEEGKRILESLVKETKRGLKKRKTGICRTYYMVFIFGKDLDTWKEQHFYDCEAGSSISILFLSDERNSLPQTCTMAIHLEGERGSISDKSRNCQIDFAPVYVEQDIDLCYLQLANLESEQSRTTGRRVVELYLPAIGTVYDTGIPADCRISEIIPLLEKEIEEKTGGAFCPEDAVLCEREAGILLNAELTPEQHGILNGTRLMLI